MRPRAAWIVSLWLAVVVATPPAQSGQAVPVAADPVLEARVNALAAELRCLVCQNQSLADSHAELAVDLKNQVREQLAAGRSYKADGKPAIGGQVTFEQVLIDAGVPAEKRARLLAEAD